MLDTFRPCAMLRKEMTKERAKGQIREGDVEVIT